MMLLYTFTDMSSWVIMYISSEWFVLVVTPCDQENNQEYNS